MKAPLPLSRSFSLLRRARRSFDDPVLSSLAMLGGVLARLLPSTVVQGVTISIGALFCSLSWPLSGLRRRARAEGLRISPLRLGSCYGRNLSALLGAESSVRVRGWDGAAASLGGRPGSRGLVVLSAHLGPWESGARELARRGLDPAVVASPWPRLPRTTRAVAALRARGGVRTFLRGRAGWRGATRHLRRGGSVVVLVDSGRPRGAGRRSRPFVGGSIAAPDAVVRWARRQGAALWVAAGQADGFELHVLPPASAMDQADRATSMLRDAVLAAPSQWGWVRALAGWALLVSLVGWGCDAGPLPPPLPLDPEGWTAVAEQVSWDGSVPGHGLGRLKASRMEGTWEGQAPRGQFDAVQLWLLSADGRRELAWLQADTATGTWPDGPLQLDSVQWELRGKSHDSVPIELRSGSLAELVWQGQGGFLCGGCALEGLGAVVSAAAAAQLSPAGGQEGLPGAP